MSRFADVAEMQHARDAWLGGPEAETEQRQIVHRVRFGRHQAKFCWSKVHVGGARYELTGYGENYDQALEAGLLLVEQA